MERAGQIRMVGGVVVFAVALLLLVASPALGSDWAEHPLGGEAASAPLYGISCPTTSLCVAVGSNNTIASSTEPLAPGGWQAVYAGEGVSAGNPNQRLIKGVSCPSAHLCVAVSITGKILTSTEPTGSASAWQVTDFDPGGPNTHFYGVSCPTTSFCVAVAGGGAIATSTNPTGGVGAWSVAHLAEPLELRGVSCNSPSFCVAVGDSGTEIRPSPNNLGEVVSSTVPSAGLWQQAELSGSHGSLYGVSCPTTGLCVSGDMFGNVVGTATPTGPASGWVSFATSVSVQITGASCSSPSHCLLVDNNGDVLTASEPLGGTHAWTAQNLIPFSTEPLVQNALFSAACASPEFCAVGGVGKVLTSVDPSTPAPQASPGGGGPKGKRPNKNKVRPKRPRVIMYSGVPNELPIPAGKAFLQFRFHVKRKFQVRGFVCSFGHQKLHRCRSPQRFRVGPGHYRFRVRAVGWTGLRGPAAEQRIRVCRRPGVVRLAGC
jgi:hypothetical protein